MENPLALAILFEPEYFKRISDQAFSACHPTVPMDARYCKQDKIRTLECLRDLMDKTQFGDAYDDRPLDKRPDPLQDPSAIQNMKVPDFETAAIDLITRRVFDIYVQIFEEMGEVFVPLVRRVIFKADVEDLVNSTERLVESLGLHFYHGWAYRKMEARMAVQGMDYNNLQNFWILGMEAVLGNLDNLAIFRARDRHGIYLKTRTSRHPLFRHKMSRGKTHNPPSIVMRFTDYVRGSQRLMQMPYPDLVSHLEAIEQAPANNLRKRKLEDLMI